MKKLLIALSIILFSCKGVNAQAKKDSIPPLKTYSVSLNPIQWQQKMDSLLILVNNFGRSLTVDEAQPWKNGAMDIISSFANQVRQQMARDTIQPPILKPKNK